MEIWKDVKGYKGIYKVSSYGRIKALSINKYSSNKHGDYCFKSKERLLKPGLVGDRGGRYLGVVLTKNKVRTSFRVHQIVAINFLNHNPNGMNMVVDHINIDAMDNRVNNLRIVTTRENNLNHNRDVTSNYRGVSWDKSRNLWRSVIFKHGKVVFLGRFNCEKQASEVYESAFDAINNK